MTVNGGTWAHQTGTSRIGDGLTITGTDTIFNLNSGLFQVRNDVFVISGANLNLNATGALSFSTPTLSADASLRAYTGGAITLGANNAVVVTDFDALRIGTDGVGVGTFNMATFNQTVAEFILGNRNLDRSGLVNGTGTLTVTGNFDLYGGTINANLASSGSGTLDKLSMNTVTLSGDNGGLASTGAMVIAEGTLILDYTSSNTTKLRAASALDMRGANLTLNGNAGAASAQTVASYTLASGGSSLITLNPGAAQSLVLNLNAITRAVNAQDGTIRFVLPSGTQSASNGITTDTLNTLGSGSNAIIGGWATVDDGTGVFFARNLTNATDGNIVAANTTLQDTVSAWLADENISDLAGFSGSLGKEFTLNSLRFNAASGSDLALGAAGHLRLTSGGLLVTGNVGGGASIMEGSLDTSSFALPVAVTELIITQDSAFTFEIGSNLHRAQNVTKSGSGTVLFSGTNTYTGYTEIQNGTLQLSGGDAVGDTSLVTLSATRDTTLELLANETIGRLAGGSRQTGQDFGTVAIGGNTLTINQTGNTTYAGFITGGGTLVKTGTGNLQLTNASSAFTGALVINQGLLYFSTAGLSNASSITINKAGSFLLDKNGSTAPTGNAVLDSTPIYLNSADGVFSGETIVRGLTIRNNVAGTRSETVGVITAGSGANYVHAEQLLADAITVLSAENVVRNNSATLVIRGSNMAATTLRRAQFRIIAANEAAFIGSMIGGAGAAGTATTSIVPWAIGEDTLNAASAATNMGNSLVTYTITTGFRPLDFNTEYANYAAAGDTNNTRESLVANLTGLSGRILNSLVINNEAGATPLNVTGTGATQVLTNTSGAFLFTLTGGSPSTAYSTVLGGFDGGIETAAGEYIFHVVNPSGAATTSTLTVTVTSPLDSTADITKSGRGTLILSGINAAGGNTNKTSINEGVLEIAGLDNIGGSTGSVVFAGGALRLGTGFTEDISTRNLSFMEGGATLDLNGNNLTLANSIGGGGAGGFTKIGKGNLTLNAAATYAGATQFTDGILTLGVSNALPSGTSLLLGNGNTAATLDLNGFDQVLGALVNTTNSALLTTQVIVNTGNTLTVNGPVHIGADAAASTTLFSATGGGSFVQNQVGGTFQIGGGTGGTNTNLGIVDFSGLANFTSDLGNTGVFRIGDNNSNGSGSPSTNSTLTLAGTSNTITAGILGIGDAQGQGGTVTLELGGGTNVINADTIYIGAATATARSSGALIFDGAGGTLTLRGSSGGTSRADVAMTTSTIGTGFNQVNSFLTAGHSVDLRIDSFVMSERTVNTGSVTSTFTFDDGTLDITNLVMSRRSGAGTGDSTSFVTIGGGTATIGSIDMASSTGTGTSSDSFATLTISGGTVSIGDGLNTGTAINMANTVTGRVGTSTITLTGGNVDVTGDIIRTGGAGTENATVTLNGATLDMNGNDIGTGAAQITLTAQSGRLENLGQLNGGANLTKSTGGTLILEGTNTYTGNTVISGGILQLGSGVATGTLNTASAISVASGATFAVYQNDTVTQGIDFSSAAISGDGSFQQTGSGTTILTTANLYTGGTSVTDGILEVNNGGGSGTGTGAVSVTGDAILTGHGSIQGNTTVSAGATLTAGFDGISDRTLTFGGNLTMESNSIWLVDLVNQSNTSDSVTVGGLLTLNGELDINQLGPAFVNDNSFYTIATYGSRNGFFSNAADGTEVSIGGGTWLINYGGTGAGTITLTAVPEPGTFGLLGLALAGFLFRRIRKRRAGTAITSELPRDK